MDSSTSPRVLVYNSIHSATEQRGITRYFQHILRAITRKYDSTCVYPSDVTDPRHANARLDVRTAAHNIHALRNLYASALASVIRPDIIFSPYYGKLVSSKPKVFTVYDMIYERFPEHFKSRTATRRFIQEKRRCIESAAFLLAISSATAEDIVTIYPYIDPEKIVVTPLGVDDSFFDRDEIRTNGNRRPYFLYVGHRSHYKNFERALAAFGESGLAKEFEFRIVSPSGSSFTLSEQALIHRYNLHQSVHLDISVTEVELRKLYANAVALIYPSEYEGFGLPILEAMASGTLVATSNVSSMPEVGGDVAEYFDPRSIESIAISLQRIALLSEELRVIRVAEGIARARSFSWERCQTQTITAFERYLCRY